MRAIGGDCAARGVADQSFALGQVMRVLRKSLFNGTYRYFRYYKKPLKLSSLDKRTKNEPKYSKIASPGSYLKFDG